jgi:hypothetical protein
MQTDLWTYDDTLGRVDMSGFSVEALDGSVGKVVSNTLDADQCYLLVESGSPLLGKRRVLVPAGLVERVDRDDETVYLRCREDDVKEGPAYDPDQPAELQYEQLTRHYKRTRQSGGERDGAAAGTAADLWTYRPDLAPGELVGYDVEAIDGSIGKVDEATARAGASYAVVDTGSWIFGKKVLLPAGLIERVDPGSRTLYVARSKDELKDAPEFDESSYRDERYRDQLSAYYSR